jgi:hypothetical protein
MWPQFLNMALGLWLMAAPAVLGYGPPGSHSDHIVGPLVVTFACIALWEATRPMRWVCLPLGVWLVAAPWVLGHPVAGQISSVATGMAIAGLSFLGGRISRQFGGGWSMLWAK